MRDAKIIQTPLGSHLKLAHEQSPQNEEEKLEMETVPYASALGSLMYLMVCSRPDLAFSVSLVSRFMSNPGKPHWSALKGILRYLKETRSVGIVLKKNQNSDCCVDGYANANYIGDVDKRKSTFGFVFTLWGNVVSWKSKLQHMVTLSSTESEYVALTEAVKEASWLKGLINELGLEQQTMVINSDSQSAIHLCKNQVFHERTKHVDVRLHFIREMIEKREIKIKKVKGSHNPANMFTKPVPVDKQRPCMSLLQVQECTVNFRGHVR
ncbi:secreted RxLR effector protein 161-like [Pistacia vera]|uniref:secreted RxLR effector protein 161-like n=1 Tax=Pistacia vera TaxID=55513 RepID=UPI001263C197|nr:secreted RxLR effector protein 161-like [Pistacia vera]